MGRVRVGVVYIFTNIVFLANRPANHRTSRVLCGLVDDSICSSILVEIEDHIGLLVEHMTLRASQSVQT
jgi:hypothetical protein